MRQPVQDGEAAAYDILLADGRRVMLNEDSDSYVRAGDPRAVSSFELIFAGSKARTPLPPLPPVRPFPEPSIPTLVSLRTT